MLRPNAKMSLLVALAVLIGGGPAHAVAPIVQDRAKFFSTDAVKKANEQLRELYVKHDKDLFIETHETVPADQIEKVKTMSREERLKFFEDWAKSRIQQRAVNGVYVLICKEPTILFVEVSPKARSAFDGAARTKLRDQLIEDFRDKHYDEGLANAVKLAREKLAGPK